MGKPHGRRVAALQWRSDQPITPERWRQARELRGITLEDFATTYEVDLDLLRAIERGQAQPSRELLLDYGNWSGFPPAFFFLEPPEDQMGKTTLDWHMVSYVCDDCEAKTGEEVDASFHCRGCERDLCEVHVCFLEGEHYCAKCHRRRIRGEAPATARKTGGRVARQLPLLEAE